MMNTPSYPSAAADLQTQLLVLGAGPGGYTAAFRAADLGLQVVLVERYATLGGVCLNVGCIPSKTLLHIAQVVNEATSLAEHGVIFDPPRIDLTRLQAWKTAVVSKLAKGLMNLAKQRKVRVVQGVGHFLDPYHLAVATPTGRLTIAFQHAIIATGSTITRLPEIPYHDPRVLDSTSALTLSEIPPELLVIGGGIIGLEMATVYAALGARVTLIEATPNLIPDCDADLVRPLQRRLDARGVTLHLSAKVTKVTSDAAGLMAQWGGPSGNGSRRFDRVLIAVGRHAQGAASGAAAAGVLIDECGCISVDHQQRTNVPHIFAIGDVVGHPMLAHKAAAEGRVAAAAIAGANHDQHIHPIPSVAYTDPEIAWVGLTETMAQQQAIPYTKGTLPWGASGRAVSLGRAEGLTKLLFDPVTEQLLGAGIVGPGAGELIAEATLALTIGANVHDIAKTIHPHPSLSETLALAAAAYLPKAKL